MKSINIFSIALLLSLPLQAAIEDNIILSEDLTKVRSVKSTTIPSIIPPIILGIAAALTAVFSVKNIHKGMHGFKYGFERKEYRYSEVSINGILHPGRSSVVPKWEKDSDRSTVHTIAGGIALALSAVCLTYAVKKFKARSAAKKVQRLSQSPARA